MDRPLAETTEWESHQDEDVVQKVKPGDAASAGHPQCSSEALLTSDGEEPVLSPHRGTSEEDLRQMKSTPEVLNKRCSLDSNQSSFTNVHFSSTEIKMPSPQQNEQPARTEHTFMTADIPTCKDIVGIKSGTEDLSSTSITESEELVSVLSQPFWRNSDNLCWLDALLVALVNCKSLKTCKPKDDQWSCVWRLIKGYEDICTAIQVHQQTGRGKLNRLQYTCQYNVISKIFVIFLFGSVAFAIISNISWLIMVKDWVPQFMKNTFSHISMVVYSHADCFGSSCPDFKIFTT